MPNVPREIKGKNPKFIERLHERFADVMNGRISFGDGNNMVKDNLDIKWLQVVTPIAADTDFTITHNLGKPLSGYILCQKSAACDVYTSPTVNANPLTQFILRATGSLVALVLYVF